MLLPDSRIAIFLATSGHSGVDRWAVNLLQVWSQRGFAVDLLHIRGHGPILPALPPNVHTIDLHCNHVATSLASVIHYLRKVKPSAILSDKDRVNRIAILAHRIARSTATLSVRVGTTVSVNLAARPVIERGLQRLSMRYLYPLAHNVLVPSQGVADDLERFSGLPRTHIRVVPSPILSDSLYQQAQLQPAHQWCLNKDKRLIIAVGELSPRKDFATLLHAFARINADLSFRLLILGEGQQRPALRALIQTLGMDHSVDLIGFQANPYAFLARADLFVLSSRWEGMPVALIEALGLGIPVVSTDCPSGPRELLHDGIGHLVPVGDAEAMASAMRATLLHPPPAALLRAAVRDYDVQVAADRYLTAMGISGHL